MLCKAPIRSRPSDRLVLVPSQNGIDRSAARHKSQLHDSSQIPPQSWDPTIMCDTPACYCPIQVESTQFPRRLEEQ